jgi:sec-independent protein translocase protein TatA
MFARRIGIGNPSRIGHRNLSQEETRTVGLDNPIHIAFLLILLLLVFGAKRLPEMGRSLGDGMRGFKDALSGEGAQPTTTEPVHQPATQPVAQPSLVAHQQEPVASIAAVQSAPQPLREKLPA